MKKIIFSILFLLLGILTAQAQRNSKLFIATYDKEPAKEGRKPVFNKYDSSFNKKLSRQKKKENAARRRRGKSNARIREMEVTHNKRSAEFGRMMERKGRGVMR